MRNVAVKSRYGRKSMYLEDASGLSRATIDCVAKMLQVGECMCECVCVCVCVRT
jgi:uncharacterized protein YerC